MTKLTAFISIILFVFIGLSYSAEKPKLYAGKNVLACANYNDGPSSSDLSLIVQLESNGTFFVNEGSEVKYIIPEDEIKGFHEMKFDDSKWLSGISGVGYSDNDDNTVVKSGTITVYTRYHFIVKDINSVKELKFRADYDDQFIAWLNGIEIARSPGICIKDGIPDWNVGAIRGGCIANHEASNAPAGKPNKDRKYQLETNVEFIPALAPVYSSGSYTIKWGHIKNSYR